MIPLVLCSVISLAVTIERFLLLAPDQLQAAGGADARIGRAGKILQEALSDGQEFALTSRPGSRRRSGAP